MFTWEWERKLVDVVDAEFEGAALFAGLLEWIDDEDALVAGPTPGSRRCVVKVGNGDVELLDGAVFLNDRPRCRVDDFGCGVSRLEEMVNTCYENGRLNCVA
jgi:hypothetical protein